MLYDENEQFPERDEEFEQWLDDNFDDAQDDQFYYEYQQTAMELAGGLI